MAVETVFVVPMLLTLMLSAIQFALVYDARSTCQAAASAGANAAAGQRAPAGAGAAAAHAFLAGVASSSLHNPVVSEQAGTQQVTITCRGTAQALVPGMGTKLMVRQAASAPKERWTTP